jgi:uncharacterized protein
MAAKQPFWERKSLAEMTKKEWESLCDGCGRCCLNKFEDESTGIIEYTDVACFMLDCSSCACKNYAERAVLVKDCITLTTDNLEEMAYMPETCAYKRLNEGKKLFKWHPLITGNPNSVKEAGISVAGRVISEEGMSDEDMEDRVVNWPMTTITRKPK